MTASTLPSKKLTRSRDARWIAGVCGGLAEYTGIDVTLIRLVAAAATVLGAGSLVLIYLICWILIPATDAAPRPPSTSSR